MKEYIIVRKPGDFSWDKVPSLEMNESMLPDDVFIRARAQICYDDEALFVRLSCDEKEIRAELFGPFDEVCEDSCLEFFFSPMEGDRRYFNIECNLNGALYLGFGSDVHSLVRLFPEEMPIRPSAAKMKEGWEVTYSVPFEFIRRFFPDFHPKSGGVIRANCYKCGERTQRPHYFCWNPIPYSAGSPFHNPDAFGIMRLA